jgi:hypothetical protein
MKSPDLDVFTAECYHIFRKELMPKYFKLFQKNTGRRTLPNSFYKASITLIPKADKDAL